MTPLYAHELQIGDVIYSERQNRSLEINDLRYEEAKDRVFIEFKGHYGTYYPRTYHFNGWEITLRKNKPLKSKEERIIEKIKYLNTRYQNRHV